MGKAKREPLGVTSPLDELVRRRVVAIQSADTDEVRLYGYGSHMGDEVPPPGIQFMGIDLNELGYPNPKILLDSGKVVWGCECWWGSEEKAKAMLAGRRIVEVDIDEERKKARSAA